MRGSTEPKLDGGALFHGLWLGLEEGRLISPGDVGLGPNGSSVEPGVLGPKGSSLELGPVDPPGADGGEGMVGIASVGAAGRSTSRVLLSRLLHGPHTNM